MLTTLEHLIMPLYHGPTSVYIIYQIVNICIFTNSGLTISDNYINIVKLVRRFQNFIGGILT